MPEKKLPQDYDELVTRLIEIVGDVHRAFDVYLLLRDMVDAKKAEELLHRRGSVRRIRA